MEGPVVLFDGVCNLCQTSVKTILRLEADHRLRFASLQSEAGAALLAEHGLPPLVGDPDSVVLIERGRVFQRSTAALKVALHLRYPYRLAALLIVVPRPLRDAAYKVLARNRYRWFGKDDACWVPKPALRARFLEHARPAA